jgi:hypothetical protein
MNDPVRITSANTSKYFYLEPLTPEKEITNFECSADIEHNEGVRIFYEKNGFLLNGELYNKNRKTISMRKYLYR